MHNTFQHLELVLLVLSQLAARYRYSYFPPKARDESAARL